MPTTMHTLGALLVSCWLSIASAAGGTGELWLVLPGERTRLEAEGEALASALERRAGVRVRVRIPPSVAHAWNAIRGDAEPLLVLGEAHLVGALIEDGYRLVARRPGIVSYAVVTSPRHVFLDADDLTGRRIAVTAPPSLAWIRINGIFSDPLRIPLLIAVDSEARADALLAANRVDAAVIEASRIGGLSERSSVLTTESAPAPALVASPAIDRDVLERVRDALVGATHRRGGVPRFAAGFEESYRELSSLAPRRAIILQH